MMSAAATAAASGGPRGRESRCGTAEFDGAFEVTGCSEAVGVPGCVSKTTLKGCGGNVPAVPMGDSFGGTIAARRGRPLSFRGLTTSSRTSCT